MLERDSRRLCATRYAKDGFTLVSAELTAKLDKLVAEIEAQSITFKGWATPGATLNSAALDVARTVCRRAERAVVTLTHTEKVNPHALVYLNRLSDFLFVLARVANDGGKGDVLWVPGASRGG